MTTVDKDEMLLKALKNARVISYTHETEEMLAELALADQEIDCQWFRVPPVSSLFSKTYAHACVFGKRLEVTYNISTERERLWVTAVYIRYRKKGVRDNVRSHVEYYFSFSLRLAIAFLWTHEMVSDAADKAISIYDRLLITNARTGLKEIDFVNILRASVMNILYRGENWKRYFEGVDRLIRVAAEKFKLRKENYPAECILLVAFGCRGHVLTVTPQDNNRFFYTHITCQIASWENMCPAYDCETVAVKSTNTLTEAARWFGQVNLAHVLPPTVETHWRIAYRTRRGF